ncbi:host attachment protein [Phenylobacterium sp.]|uniref:host attachment family protein n=1 Tax=Phenylobacterium sp. TaxID=1871053 RepID=UPI00286DA76E|nr:host attachment protein [Phenylobacterium sp.]
MQLPKGATVAVADGATLHIYRNGGDELNPKLTLQPAADLAHVDGGAGSHHRSSAGNHDDSTQIEDGFAASTAGWLNSQVLGGKIDDLFIIAAPKTLGELRRHYHKALQAKLLGELAKDLTGHAIGDIETAISNA